MSSYLTYPPAAKQTVCWVIGLLKKSCSNYRASQKLGLTKKSSIQKKRVTKLHLVIDSIDKGQGCNDKVSKGKACVFALPLLSHQPKRSDRKPRFTCAQIKSDQKPNPHFITLRATQIQDPHVLRLRATQCQDSHLVRLRATQSQDPHVLRLRVTESRDP